MADVLYEDSRLGSLIIFYKKAQRTQPDSLLAFMPAALPPARPDRAKQIISRFNWQSLWPASDVLAFADPALQVASELDGAWFINPDHDIIEAIASVVKDHADAHSIDHRRIVFYGSSLGGFGAIAAASCLEGARAVAEVPQVNFNNWGEGARQQVEKYVIHMPLSDYMALHPEQLYLPARLEHSGLIPPIHIITNRAEIRLREQEDFYAWSQTSPLPKIGPFEMTFTDEISGHGSVSRETARRLLHP